MLLNITCPLQRIRCASNMWTNTHEKQCFPRAHHSLHPPSHPPSILTWDPKQEEPQELRREPHVQTCELKSPDKSERDQS